MVAIADAKEQLKNWIDKNLIMKIPGEGKRALVAVIANRVIQHGEQLLGGGMPGTYLLSGTGIIRDGMIDENVLLELRDALGSGTIDIVIPLVGTFALDKEAVESLYQALISKG